MNYQKRPDEILIAPSWNYYQENFMNKNVENIIEEVLNRGFKVRYRPHPENFKRSKKILDSYKKKFINHEFILDDSIENIASMENAKCLITDNSGIAIEYTLIFKRPVLYLTGNEKLHNKEIDDYKDFVNLEDNIKKLFGYKFNVNDIENLDQLINNSIINFLNKKFELDEFIDINFYNNNNTAIFLINNIDDILYK